MLIFIEANGTLTRLDLGENNLTSATINEISKALNANRTLRELILRDNDLGVPGGNMLSTMLRHNHTLTAINLNGCNLCSLGGKVSYAIISLTTFADMCFIFVTGILTRC